MISSLRPAPYTSAVSRNVTPASADARSTSIASSSDTSPHWSPPICQHPSPTSDTGTPQNERDFMGKVLARVVAAPFRSRLVVQLRAETGRERLRSHPADEAGEEKRRRGA